MVSEKKKKQLEELKKELAKWSVVGIVNMHKLPGRQLFQIKQKLIGKAAIRMVKKRIITRALEQAGLKNLQALEPFVSGSPAILLSNENPFKLARVIEQSKSSAPAKPGDIAPTNIVVRAGPTSLPPGPVIGEFQKAKIPAGVQEGKIAVLKDTTVAKAGDAIPEDATSIMAKLGMEPMEIGLNLVAAWERGTVYEKDVLFVPHEKYLEDISRACAEVLNLTVNINYPTPQNIGLLLSKASGEARSLALNAGILTPDTIGGVLAQAQAEAESLKTKLDK